MENNKKLGKNKINTVVIFYSSEWECGRKNQVWIKQRTFYVGWKDAFDSSWSNCTTEQAAKKGHRGLDCGNTHKGDQITQVKRISEAQPRAFA